MNNGMNNSVIGVAAVHATGSGRTWDGLVLVIVLFR